MQDNDFLHKIASDPEPDLPRLIYADWLEERGDPRAEFIRLQCERARLHPTDPRHQELLHRENWILIWHRNDWVRDYYLKLGLPGGRFVFRRGVIDEAQLDAEALLKYGPALFAEVPTLRRLEIQRIQAKHWEPLQQLDCLKSIVGLKLAPYRRGAPIPWREMLSGWPCLEKLKALDLQECGPSATGSQLQQLQGDRVPKLEMLRVRLDWNDDYELPAPDGLFSRLRVLMLGHTWQRPAWWVALFRHAARLEQLEICWGCDLVEELLASPGLQRLHTLDTMRYEYHWRDVGGRREHVPEDRFSPDQLARLQARFGADCLRDVYLPWS